MGNLNGKIAAVTGGASGIGEAIVRLFVDAGARVAFADRDATRGRAVEDDIRLSGGDVLFVEARTDSESEAMGFIGQAAEQFGLSLIHI